MICQLLRHDVFHPRNCNRWPPRHPSRPLLSFLANCARNRPAEALASRKYGHDVLVQIKARDVGLNAPVRSSAYVCSMSGVIESVAFDAGQVNAHATSSRAVVVDVSAMCQVHLCALHSSLSPPSPPSPSLFPPPSCLSARAILTQACPSGQHLHRHAASSSPPPLRLRRTLRLSRVPAPAPAALRPPPRARQQDPRFNFHQAALRSEVRCRHVAHCSAAASVSCARVGAHGAADKSS